jgi:hypothetical protein
VGVVWQEGPGQHGESGDLYDGLEAIQECLSIALIPEDLAAL